VTGRALRLFRKSARRCVAAAAVAAAVGCASRSLPNADWPITGGDAGNTRYSTLDQITRDNVGQLRVAWVYHTGDMPVGDQSQIQATPIVVDGVLYTTTPALAVLALRADRGTLLWRFDPFAGGGRATHVNRGVVYWTDGARDRRIFITAGRKLYALSADDGRPVASFGDSGSIDLSGGLDRDIDDAYLVATSPGVVFEDLLIQGTRVGEEEGSAPGDVRAYDARTGKIRWSFHTIPRPGEFGVETWPRDAWRTAGGANSWAGMSVDVARGIVYVPTGSATPDFYGGDRAGANLFANTLLALDARTGKRVWHFQTVHHDIWDRDLPAAPNLLRLTRSGQPVDALAQITKSGFVFVFDRATGRSLFPIEERPVPPSDLAGEIAWPTQPFPLAPAPFARQSMTESDVTDLSPSARSTALARFHTLRSGALFTPPSKEGSVVLPGFDGGGEWGGAAVDPESGVIYVNASDVPWIAAMRESASLGPPSGVARSGSVVYRANCASCHGEDRRGKDRAPSLVGISDRLNAEQIVQILNSGRGFMPSFAALPEEEKRNVTEYLTGKRVAASTSPRKGPRAARSHYEFIGYERWRDSAGFPAIGPPWGTLSAINLNTGAYRWRIPLGRHPRLTADTRAETGTEQYGGPIVTAGGLVFIAATQDAKLRAFDKTSGKLLWESTLPAAGYATPSTVAVRGKQYIVIAAGGGKLGTRSGDAYVAYALP
jgi:quinoprotein glucose dehydrogenase